LDEATAAAQARPTRTPIEVVKYLYGQEIDESKSGVENFIDVIAAGK
jgi:hypothetical protein